MPNGGVPLSMVLRPKKSNVVIHCRTGEIDIYSRDEWDEKIDNIKLGDGPKNSITPLVELTEEESAAIVSFSTEWLKPKIPTLIQIYSMGLDLHFADE